MKVHKVTADVEIPKVPNHLRLTNGSRIAIEAIGESELKAIGKAWTAALVEQAAGRRKTVAAPEPEGKTS